jgi:hypothetical protein
MGSLARIFRRKGGASFSLHLLRATRDFSLQTEIRSLHLPG